MTAFSACVSASSGPAAEGSVGAGTGATVGKLLGIERAVKGGIGTADVDLEHRLVVAAIVAVNAVGGIVIDPETGRLLAGPRKDDDKSMHDSMQLVTTPGFVPGTPALPTNTTIGVVAPARA